MQLNERGARPPRAQPTAPPRLALVVKKQPVLEPGTPSVFGARARRTAPGAGALPFSNCIVSGLELFSHPLRSSTNQWGKVLLRTGSGIISRRRSFSPNFYAMEHLA